MSGIRCKPVPWLNLKGAHTWNIFRAQNGKVYSLDSLWNDVTCITDKPGAINALYRQDVEGRIQKMHFAPEDAEEKIIRIKQYIENHHFTVGNYLL